MSTKNKRSFSKSVKLAITMENLEKNGVLRCCHCSKNLKPKDMHFDHIEPYSIGGKSTLENCQILCSNCNLKKSAKNDQLFALQIQASEIVDLQEGNSTEPRSKKDFPSISEGSINGVSIPRRDYVSNACLTHYRSTGKLVKEDFFNKKFSLPPLSEVKILFGSLSALRTDLGIVDSFLQNPTKDGIILKCNQLYEELGELRQKHISNKYGLPSLPTVLNLFEMDSFVAFKSEILKINEVRFTNWTKELAIEAAKRLMDEFNCEIRQHHLSNKYGMPGTRIIDRLFGSLAEFQAELGIKNIPANKRYSRKDVVSILENFFDENGREYKNLAALQRKLPISYSTVNRLIAMPFSSIS